MKLRSYMRKLTAIHKAIYLQETESECPIVPGDQVYLRVFRRKWNEPRREGPYKVVRATPTAVQVEGSITWYHLNHCTRVPKVRTETNQIKSLLLSHHHSTSALVSEILMSVLQTVQKTKQKQKTTIHIWTVHIYRLYRRQCAKYTYIYSVHIVYYKDILNYQLHIIHRMCTSTLCTLSIHYVVYT